VKPATADTVAHVLLMLAGAALQIVAFLEAFS